MRRREFIALLGGAVVTWSRAADAQPAGRVVRLGVLVNEDWPPLDGLRQGLRELGYREGQDLQIEYRFAQGQTERYPAFAAELIDLKVDAIVTWSTPATLAAKRATSTIPIVFIAGDPIAAGIVSNLSRPGRNITGVSSQISEGEGKRLELLKELLPNLSRVGVLSNPANPYCLIAEKHLRLGAQALGLEVEVVPLSRERDIDGAFQTLRRLRPDAVQVIADPFLVSQRRRIAEFMIESRLPSIYTYRENVVAGGLLSYSTSFHALFQRAAQYVDKILKGTKPGDLPVEQPTVFELVINLETAKALGIELPPSILARADEVIE